MEGHHTILLILPSIATTMEMTGGPGAHKARAQVEARAQGEEAMAKAMPRAKTMPMAGRLVGEVGRVARARHRAGRLVGEVGRVAMAMLMEKSGKGVPVQAACFRRTPKRVSATTAVGGATTALAKSMAPSARSALGGVCISQKAHLLVLLLQMVMVIATTRTRTQKQDQRPLLVLLLQMVVAGRIATTSLLNLLQMVMVVVIEENTHLLQMVMVIVSEQNPHLHLIMLVAMELILMLVFVLGIASTGVALKVSNLL